MKAAYKYTRFPVSSEVDIGEKVLGCRSKIFAFRVHKLKSIRKAYPLFFNEARFLRVKIFSPFYMELKNKNKVYNTYQQEGL